MSEEISCVTCDAACCRFIAEQRKLDAAARTTVIAEFTQWTWIGLSKEEAHQMKSEGGKLEEFHGVPGYGDTSWYRFKKPCPGLRGWRCRWWGTPEQPKACQDEPVGGSICLGARAALPQFATRADDTM